MGNQQLLPLVLATIIVGIAIVRGMQMFREENVYQNKEEIRTRLLDIAGRAQSWYYRPLTLGGGGRTFAAVDWEKLGLDPYTAIAHFTISERSPESFRITGASLEDPDTIISYAFVYPDSIILLP